MFPEMPYPTTASCEDVWDALADHFLDTDTRVWIPRSARMCVAAGLSRDEAFEAWAYEVTPALWTNAWSVAGEWAYWDRAWLVTRIRHVRERPSPLAYAKYRVRAHALHSVWCAIAACIDVLHAAPAGGRDLTTDELRWLAAQFFDFARSAPPPAESTPAALTARYRSTFLPIFAPLVVRAAPLRESVEEGERRVLRAVEQLAR
jgi:hypothetical protein